MPRKNRSDFSKLKAEPEILPSSSQPNCLTSTDARQPVRASQGLLIGEPQWRQIVPGAGALQPTAAAYRHRVRPGPGNSLPALKNAAGVRLAHGGQRVNFHPHTEFRFARRNRRGPNRVLVRLIWWQFRPLNLDQKSKGAGLAVEGDYLCIVHGCYHL